VLIKADKTVRLCVDFRPLNKITQNDPYPTGNLHEVLDNLGFSAIDLAQGYLQVPLAMQDRPETAFRSPTGFWKWTRMPYRLKGSPATFSRLMQKVLGHIPSHLVNLEGVFQALRHHGLRLLNLRNVLSQ
jgi:hypothetical protein